MKISLEKATLKDLEIVLDIENFANSKTYFGRHGEQEVRDYIKKDVVYLIKREGFFMGTASYKIKDLNHAHINALIVKPEFRGQGIAKRAMEILLDELKNKKRIDLTVHPHNNIAIALYLSSGFIIELWKDNYFKDGEPRLVMVYKKDV